MGSRYAKIVAYLGLTPVIHDMFHDNPEVFESDFIIDAMPTQLRGQTLLFADRRPKKPFLLEKPFDRKTLNNIPPNVRMINQYEYYLAHQADLGIKNIVAVQTKKETVYDYWRSGKDGIIWDCINIVGLADDDSDIDLRNDSLIWNCVINNKKLDLSLMDVAYVWNIFDWLTHQDANTDYIYKAHKRCWELEHG